MADMTLAQLSVTKTGVLLNYDYEFFWLLTLLTMDQINLHAYNEKSEVRGGREGLKCM